MTSARYCIFRHLPKFDERASLFPLAKKLNAELLEFDFTYKQVGKRSWRAGHYLKMLGNWHARSTWNALVPWVDERRFLRAIKSGQSVVHFLWGEFASPHRAAPYHRRGARLIGTFHCSARRLPRVLKGFEPSRRYDYITLMSATQIPYFVEHGFPEERLRVILHGVDISFFSPPATRSVDPDRLRLLVVGDTERDHAFAAQVFARLVPDQYDIRVKTRNASAHYYRALDHVHLLPRLSGEELRDAYRNADLLVLPMLDCTANNAVLESMACGTPVMTNRIGGIAEYVSADGNIVLDEKNVDEWVDLLNHYRMERRELEAMRPSVRQWAERFDWDLIVPEYEDVYNAALQGVV